ncbi:hypothetical protein J6590_025151 [Homalodisca vitripennis]|nr:hypothetical protein J6590_025151 [Homalodisca vitripennis]
MIKKVWRGEPEGVRPLGRPRMRWRDQVEKDLRTIGATLEVAQDRGSWRDIVGEVKNHLGFEWPHEITCKPPGNVYFDCILSVGGIAVCERHSIL